MKTSKDETNMSYMAPNNNSKAVLAGMCSNSYRPISAFNKRPEKSLKLNGFKPK